MPEMVDLKTLERKTYRSYFQDGIIEISLGTVLLGGGIAPLLLEVGVPTPLNMLIFLVPALVFQFAGKYFITRLRLGRVKFGPRRVAARKKLLMVSIPAFIATLVLVILTAAGLFPSESGYRISGLAFTSIIGLGVIGLVGVFAYLNDYPRLAIIGVLVGVGVPVSELLRAAVGSPYGLTITFGTVGLIVLSMGVGLLIQFLRQYPLSAIEE